MVMIAVLQVIVLAENKTQSICVQDKGVMCELLIDHVETNEHDYARPSCSIQVEHLPPPPPAVQPATSTPGALSTITSVLSDSPMTSDFCK